MGNLGSVLAANQTMQPGDFLTSPNGAYTLTMQVNTGDLVLGLTGQTATPPAWLWQSFTSGNPRATCTLLATGDLAIFSRRGKLISHSATSFPRPQLAMDDNGGIVIYSNGMLTNWRNGQMYSVLASALIQNMKSAMDTLQRDLAQLEASLRHPGEADQAAAE